MINNEVNGYGTATATAVIPTLAKFYVFYILTKHRKQEQIFGRFNGPNFLGLELFKQANSLSS